MGDIRTITTRAIHDAFAIRGLDHSGGGLLRTASPETYMDEGRLRLAREVLRHLPAEATATKIDRLVERLLPMIANALKPGHGQAEADTGGIMFLS